MCDAVEPENRASPGLPGDEGLDEVSLFQENRRPLAVEIHLGDDAVEKR